MRSWCICVQPRRRACVGACVCECVGACVQVGSASCGFGINCNYGTQACKQCIIVTAVLVYKYYNIPIMYNPYINLCMYIFNNVDHVSLPRRQGWFFKQWSSRSAALLKEVLSLHTSTKQKTFLCQYCSQRLRGGRIEHGEPDSSSWRKICCIHHGHTRSLLQLAIQRQIGTMSIRLDDTEARILNYTASRTHKSMSRPSSIQVNYIPNLRIATLTSGTNVENHGNSSMTHVDLLAEETSDRRVQLQLRSVRARSGVLCT